MRIPWKLLGLAFPVSLLVACSEQTSTPNSNTLAFTGPMAADYSNNPDGGGPNLLYRGPDGGWTLVLSDDHYVVAFFADSLTRCGHQFPPQAEVGQYKGDISTFFHWVGMGKTMNVYVVDLTRPITCSVPAGGGTFVGWSETGNLSMGDNELWNDTTLVPIYADSYRFVGTATLTTPSGRKGHVTAGLHCVANRGHDYSYRCNSHITVN